MPSILGLIARRSWHLFLAAAFFAFGDSAACRRATAAVVELYPFAHFVLYCLLSILKPRELFEGSEFWSVLLRFVIVKLVWVLSRGMGGVGEVAGFGRWWLKDRGRGGASLGSVERVGNKSSS